MTPEQGDSEAAEALLAFLKAISVVISALDGPMKSVASSQSFLKSLDEVLAETPNLPGGAEIYDKVQVLREMLGQFVGKSRDIEELFREVGDIFGDGNN